MSSNVFADQRALMDAFGHSTSSLDYDQASLLQDLVDEEYDELAVAMSMLHAEHLGAVGGGVTPATMAEVIDGAVDLLVVTLGLLYSLGVDAQGAWDEVFRSNMSKVQPDGKVLKDETGKVQKGPSFVLPDLLPLAEDALAA